MIEPLLEAAAAAAAAAEAGGPDLFEHYRVPLPAAPAANSGAIGALPVVRLAWSRPSDGPSDAGQLELALRERPSDRAVVAFVSARQRNYLNYSIRDLARRVPELSNAVRLLSRKGVHFVGDLLPRERGYLVHVVGLDDHEVRAFDALLAQAGLRTNMPVPDWMSPFSRTG